MRNSSQVQTNLSSNVHTYNNYVLKLQLLKTNNSSIFFILVGSGSISTVLPPSDYYNTSYQQYSSYGYGYPSGMGSGSLLSK